MAAKLVVFYVNFSDHFIKYFIFIEGFRFFFFIIIVQTYE